MAAWRSTTSAWSSRPRTFCSPDRGVGQQDRLAGRQHPHLLLPLRSADEQALADRGACVQLGGMMTVVSLGSFMFVMFRRDIQLGRNHDLTSKRTDDEG